MEERKGTNRDGPLWRNPGNNGGIVHLLFDTSSCLSQPIEVFWRYNKLEFGRLVSVYSQKSTVVPQPQVRWILDDPSN